MCEASPCLPLLPIVMLTHYRRLSAEGGPWKFIILLLLAQAGAGEIHGHCDKFLRFWPRWKTATIGKGLGKKQLLKLGFLPKACFPERSILNLWANLPGSRAQKGEWVVLRDSRGEGWVGRN